ncbi:hypothetical protein MPL1032_10232 [Mesorhizobium plurifarium]|uniref:Uncharacterized protein n=1 Tax=Mesorhizobium plurifarium TaxID=69974 RepID=A0A0K2VNF3_MESPL|nr:hypothetical protein MPL1032_10232 [Mesorhizobium plurifarium]
MLWEHRIANHIQRVHILEVGNPLWDYDLFIGAALYLKGAHIMRSGSGS